MMTARGGKAVSRIAAGILCLGAVTMSLSTPASAEGFFERLFGGLRQSFERPRQPINAPAYADPRGGEAVNPPQQHQLRAETGPNRAFCVRTCDGHFFPVQAHAGVTAAESCRSFCPAAETKLYGGNSIDTAAANDGSRYADLPNAFVYRKAMVAGCTCNGKNPFGLARLDAGGDPTLRQGDIVATKTGLVAFTGVSNNVANFTPVENYSRLSKSARDKLAETKVMGPAPGAAASDITSAITPVVDNPRDPKRGTVQFTR
jgi:hypothetical protein